MGIAASRAKTRRAPRKGDFILSVKLAYKARVKARKGDIILSVNLAYKARVKVRETHMCRNSKRQSGMCFRCASARVNTPRAAQKRYHSVRQASIQSARKGARNTHVPRFQAAKRHVFKMRKRACKGGDSADITSRHVRQSASAPHEGGAQ